MKNSYWINIAATLCLISIVGIILFYQQNGGYEIDLFQIYPNVFWVLCVAVYSLCVLAAAIDIFRNKDYEWGYSIALIVLLNSLILALPYFHLYSFHGQYDPANHYSNALSILQTGSPDPQDFYPISHLLAAGFASITGLDVRLIVMFFPLIFYWVSLASNAYFAWAVDNRPGVRGLFMLLATPLLYHFFGSMFYPVLFTTYLLPLFTGFIIKTRLQKNDWKTALLIVLFLLFMPFFHPWAALSAAIILASFGIAFLYQSRMGRKKELVRNKDIISPMIFVLITWWLWFSTFLVFGKTIKRVYLSFIEELSAAHSLYDFVDKAQRAQISAGKVFSMVVFTYGPALIYFIILGAILLWVAIQLIRRRQVPAYILALSVFASTFSFLALITLFRDLIAEGPTRFINFVMACTPLLVGKLLYHFSTQLKSSGKMRLAKIYQGGVGFLVICTLILGQVTSFVSPLSGQPNHQLSYAQRAGTQFMVETVQTNGDYVYSPFAGVAVLASVMSSVDLANMRQKSPEWWIRLTPDALSYDLTKENHEYVRPSYLFITVWERAYYSQVWPEGGRITAEDFIRLESDPLWNKVYTSGDFELWQYGKKQYDD